MLSAVKWLMGNEYKLDDLDMLKEAYDKFNSGEYMLERMERQGRR